jgi:hypothetical protein
MILTSIPFSEKNKTIVSTFTKDELDLFIFCRDSMIVQYPEIDNITPEMLNIVIESAESFGLKIVKGLIQYIDKRIYDFLSGDKIMELIEDQLSSRLYNILNN